MKSYILILIGLFLCCCSVKKGNSEQKTFESLLNYKGDTALYIKENFIYKKEYYMGSEINLLLNKLELPIVKYNLGVNPNLKEYYYISINFSNDDQINLDLENNLIPNILIIHLENPVPLEKPNEIIKISKQKWGQKEIEFWGKKKIKDLEIMNLN